MSLFLSRALYTVASLGFSVVLNVNAQQLVTTEQEFEQTNHTLSSYDLDISHVTFKQIESRLVELPPLEQIVLQSLWLDQISTQSDLTQAQLTWIQSLQNRQQQVSVPLLDHPATTMQLIDLAEKAASCVKLVSINGYQLQISQRFKQGSLLLNNWLDQSSLRYAALVGWLKEQSPNTVRQVARQLDDQTLLAKLPSNQLLQISLQRDFDQEIFAHLVTREADQFSHLYFQQLVQRDTYLDAIEQLSVAIENPQLSSQALVLLATHFSDNAIAQKAIEQSLLKPDLQWQVMGLMEKMTDIAFKRQLVNRFERLSPAMGKVARRQMNQGEGL